MTYLNTDKDFFGRANYLDLFKRRVVDLKEGYRQNIALLGAQYVGKSKLLQHFASNIDDDQITSIYIDLENKNFGYFFLNFSSALLYNYSKSKGLPLHDDLNLLLESVRTELPLTVNVIKKVQNNLKAGKITEAFMGLFTVPEVYSNESGKFCILILDEFQNLGDFSVPNAFKVLGKKIMMQKKCFYVLSSSYTALAQKIISEKLSLLFGNFEILEMDCFDHNHSQKFIEESLNDKRIGVGLRNFLTDFTGGHPLYLYLISQELINLAAIHNQNEIYLPIVSQAVENTIFNRWGVLSRHFELIVNDISQGKGNNIALSILMSIAKGLHKVDNIVSESDIKRHTAMVKINRLIDLGIVEKNGNYYFFKDKLFRYWMKYVYQKRLQDVELATDKLKKDFKDEFHHHVEDFNADARKDFSSRIVELLSCFDNEAFSLNGRKYKLPNLKNIVPFKLRNENGIYFDVIKASTDDHNWLIVLKKDNLIEGDVATIMDEAKRIGRKPKRCLIISLTNLDESARVKALQERMWIWNEPELNTLLTLFDKPFILS